MPEIKINNKIITVEKNKTIIEAARENGVEIPSLCYLKGYEHFTSCMLCVVIDQKSDKLIPACSINIEEGMEIVTESQRIRTARKDTIDMLLSEHVGECEARCTIGCPANMNIPKMIREIKLEDYKSAIKTVKKDIALPAILGRICSAPCENSCIHKQFDTAVSICELKRFVADKDLELDKPYLPEIKNKLNKKVAIVGAGPAGLAAAYYLQILGIEIDLYDKNEKPGGMLRYGVDENKLNKSIVDKETENLLSIGINFKPKSVLGENIDLIELSKNYDSVVLAIGTIEKFDFFPDNFDLNEKGVVVEKNTFQTSINNVFAIGNSIRSGRSAIRSCAHGNDVSKVIYEYLINGEVKAQTKRFNSSVGKLLIEEINEYAKGSDKISRATIDNDRSFSNKEAIQESGRCFHCDCRKIDNCKLRDYTDLFNGNQKRFKITQRNKFTKNIQHKQVIYESGKCIKCNLCIRITESSDEKLGLTMINRGFDITVATPFNESMNDALNKVAVKVVDNCPTAALSFSEKGEKNDE